MKIKKLSKSEIIFFILNAIAMCSPVYSYLSYYMVWYKAIYFSGIVGWIIIVFMSIAKLLHNLIDAFNEEEQNMDLPKISINKFTSEKRIGALELKILEILTKENIKKQILQREEQDRKEYERLKKKFEGKK